MHLDLDHPAELLALLLPHVPENRGKSFNLLNRSIDLLWLIEGTQLINGLSFAPEGTLLQSLVLLALVLNDWRVQLGLSCLNHCFDHVEFGGYELPLLNFVKSATLSEGLVAGLAEFGAFGGALSHIVLQPHGLFHYAALY